jgi:hypothetical protein
MNAAIPLAIIGNLVVAVTTYVYYGWNAVGGAVAARNTARFSSMFFVVALAAHFHSRFGRDYLSLIKAFIAAHVIHFGTVIAYHHIVGKLGTPMFWGIASTGTVLLAATALTMTKAPRSHLALTYVIWLAFMIAFGSNLMKRMLLEGPLVALLALAMIIHLANAFRGRKTSTSAASA